MGLSVSQNRSRSDLIGFLANKTTGVLEAILRDFFEMIVVTVVDFKCNNIYRGDQRIHKLLPLLHSIDLYPFPTGSQSLLDRC